MTTYFTDHEWVRVEGDIGTVGITKYAAEQLGDVVFIEVPETGADFGRVMTWPWLKALRYCLNVYAPVTGQVESGNEALANAPETVNEDGAGWFARLN